MADLPTHRAKLNAHLARYQAGGLMHLIGGKNVAGEQWFETRSPVDDSLIARVALGTAAEIDAAAKAAKAAKAAFPAWAALGGEKRKAKLTARVNTLKVGHPLDPVTEIGPLSHKSHFDKVMGYVDIGRNEGATLAAGGGRIGDAGWFVRPTLFTDTTPQMRIAQQEVFGPFLTSIRFNGEAEALEIANKVAYGLAGYVWTNDLTRALRVFGALEAGCMTLPLPMARCHACTIRRFGCPRP
jgi:acyl-CoA reductase-like NAD-dependent aldehyde dehydrogenase